jgi:ergothioneine biosynthesis protein EgtB
MIKRSPLPEAASEPLSEPCFERSAALSAALSADLSADRFTQIRAQTAALAAPLSEADAQVQSMPDASPSKWHLAHTTWFFETFVLERFEPQFKPHHAAFRTLFNSYYQTVGAQHPRPQRGLLTRPSLAEVRAYRAAVEERLLHLLQHASSATLADIAPLFELGLHHEQQHQELLLTDVLHLLSCNPLAPAYLPPLPAPAAVPMSSPMAAHTPQVWLPQEGGLVQIGHVGSGSGSGAGAGFAFDNESPRHTVYLKPHALAQRLVTQGEWADFVQDGGYQDPRWWLAAGWDWLRTESITAPSYWRRDEGHSPNWQVFGLRGLAPLQPHAPVCHISLYEAEAFAMWASAQQGLNLRLPTEAEWERAAAQLPAATLRAGNFVESQALQPLPASRSGAAAGLQQMGGDVWEWTRSSYLPYPGFRAWEGAVGEYNGKFMVNQTVLRGGSCATPRDHMRASYRNFFAASARWQFSGLRLAQD